jgi:hypothetical protein
VQQFSDFTRCRQVLQGYQSLRGGYRWGGTTGGSVAGSSWETGEGTQRGRAPF